MTSFSLHPSLGSPSRSPRTTTTTGRDVVDRFRPHLPALRLAAGLALAGAALAGLFLACGTVLLLAASPAITTVVDALDLTL